MKTINLELSNRLAPYLENIEVEYYYDDKFVIAKGMVDIKNYKEIGLFKTLTLEEAIEFIPKAIITKKNGLEGLTIYFSSKTMIYFGNANGVSKRFFCKNLFEAVEKMLEYLLDNNLLNK